MYYTYLLTLINPGNFNALNRHRFKDDEYKHKLVPGTDPKILTASCVDIFYDTKKGCYIRSPVAVKLPSVTVVAQTLDTAL